MKHNCDITNCFEEAVKSFFRYPNGKIWFCQKHTDEREEGKE